MLSKFGVRNIVMLVIGLCMILPNIMSYANRVQVINHGLETTAIVTSTNSGARGLYPRARVRYTIDGVEYRGVLHLTYKTVATGDEVTIL